MNNDAAIEILDRERTDLERQLSDIRKALKTLRNADKINRAIDDNSAATADLVLKTIRNSDHPMTAKEVAAELDLDGISEGAISSCISRMKKKGLVAHLPESTPKRWIDPNAPQPSAERVPNVELVSSL